MNEATRALEEIRQTELAAARRIDEARAEAEEIAARARAESRRIVEAGRERGMAEARRRLQTALDEANSEAAVIRASAVPGSMTREVATSETLEALVEEMVRVVLAPPSEPGK